MPIGFLPLILLNILLFFGLKKLHSIIKSNRWIFWTVIAMLVCSFLFGANEFSKRSSEKFGGKSFLETWELRTSEQDVFEAIGNLQKVNPNFKLPVSTSDTFISFTTNNDDNNSWSQVKLYYPDTKELVYVLIRSKSDSTSTTIALEGLSKVENPAKFRVINRDFWFLDNKQQIDKFEELIVDKIEAQINVKKKVGFR